MRNKEIPRYSWADARVELFESPIASKGIRTRAPIQQGETIMVWGGVLATKNELKEGDVNIIAVAVDQTTEGETIYLTPFDDAFERKHPSTHDNHSCEPNAWLNDEVTWVARRDIPEGQEITKDYATFTVDSNWELVCNCKSEHCRGKVTGNDWKLTELQERYKGHFSPFIEEKIAKLH